MKKFTSTQILFILFCCINLSINVSAKSNNFSPKNSNYFVDANINLINIKSNPNPHTYQLFSHGRSGELLLNGKWCNAKEIANFLQPKIQNSKFKIQNLNIYGCEFAKGTKGLQAVAYLQKTLGVSVSASINITGKDGDWVLEVGENINVLSFPNYNGNLQQCANFGTGDSQDYDCDGIINSLDLDDDNDGILDINEMTCVDNPPPCTSNILERANIASGDTLTNQLALNYGMVFGLDQTFSAGIITGATCGGAIDLGSQVWNSTFSVKFVNPFDGVTPQALNSFTVKTDCAASNEIFSWDAYDINGNFLYNQAFPSSGSLQCLTITPASNNVYSVRIHQTSSAATIYGITFASPCKDRDTDGDGIPDRLDLDSDGDGCPDAKEGGNALIPTITSTMPGGNTGSGYNGTSSNAVALSLCNSSACVSNAAATLGVPTAAGTGQNVGYSENKAFNFCTDSDGDGIPDVLDLDDDNDGILDAVESPGCFYSAAELANPSVVKTGFALTAGTIANVYDNNTSTSITFVQTTYSDGINKTAFEVTPTIPTVATSIILKSSLATTSPIGTLDATSIITAQGWNGTAWIDLLTYTANPAVSGNTQTFAFPSNTTAYQKYRLFEPAGSYGVRMSGSASITEVALGLPATYIQSANPKPTCTGSDLDGDGIPNYLDLDSDGDGCPDALEGAAALLASTLVTSSMPGGNAGGTYTGTSSSPVVKNLCSLPTCVGSTATTMGVPTAAGTGQAIGKSQNILMQSANCPVCLAGTVAPAVTPTTASATCPATVNLTTLASTGFTPTGATKIWSTHNPPTSVSDTLTTVQASAVAVSGKYYTFFYDKVNACYSPADSVTVTISPCPATPDYVVTPKPACLSCSVKACVVGNDIPAGAGTPTITTCGTPAGYTAAGPDASGCFIYTPTASVSLTTPAKSCIVICKNGVCDTTYITIPVPVKPDTIVTPPAKCPTCPVGPVCVVGDDIPAGSGTPTITTCGTPTGYTSAGPDASGCFTYTPTATVSLTTPAKNCIVICKNGVCDTTYITIPVPITPDTVTVKPTCPTCPVKACVVADNINVNSTTTYSSCGLSASQITFGTLVLDLNGCLIFQANGLQGLDTIKTCVVACNGTVCDTTYINIAPSIPPYGPDTINVTPACGTCTIVPICVTGDDLPLSITGTPTVTTCGLTPAQSALGTFTINAIGCAVWTPNGTLQKDTIKTCIIICATSTLGGAPVCDTTKIWITPPPTPDYDIVTPACPTCPIKVCPVADDIVITSATTFSTCGAPSGYTITGGPSTSGCYTFKPLSPMPTTSVTTCVVACNGTVCDTTYVVINPPISPDSVITTPACPTCPVIVCTVGDDIAVHTGATYTNCGVLTGYAQTGPDVNGCFTYTPTGAASTTTVTTCQVICKNGVCDTTYVVINPPISPDSVITTPACPTCPVIVCTVGDDIAVHTGATYTTCGVPTGYAQTGPDVNGCYTYTPTGATSTITVTTCQVICKNGVCDTTYVVIDPPISLDSVITTPACPTCPVIVCTVGDDIAVHTGATYTNCGVPTGYAQTGPDVNGCYTYTPTSATSTTTVTTCQVICKNGVCDTTYVVINPPISPDSVITTPACPTCPVIVCTVGDDIAVHTGATYTTCGVLTGYAQTGPDANGCYTYTPTSATSTTTVTTCQVICKNGVCDTTYVVINPPVSPDSVITTPACPTCPVIVCTVGDDIAVHTGATYTTCGVLTGYAQTGPDANGCYTYTPTSATSTTTVTTCQVICKNGVCDTTYVVINPPVSPDSVITTPACPTCPVIVCTVGDDIAVHTGATYTTCGVLTGYAQTGPDANGCYTYTPTSATSTTTVTTCQVICKNGVCDTTYVVINPPVSPDSVITTPACPTCPVIVCTVGDDIAVHTGATYTTCGVLTGYAQTGPDANGCYTYTPTSATSTTTVTTCQVICKNGVCDTTYVVINPPVSPDSVITTPACPTCPVIVCTVGDDIAVHTGATYTTCGVPTGYAQTGPDVNGCYTYTPTSATSTTTVTTCQVICKNGVCDTTYVVINPPVSPDSVITTPACPTCPVIVCTVGDDIAVHTGATYTTCGVPTGYAQTGPDVNGCYTYTPTSATSTTTVTTCQVICKNGVCDTTYVVIDPPISLDSVITTPACPTCPVIVCTVGDDIAVHTGATYTTCGVPTGYAQTGPDVNGCYTYTPTGATSTITVTTCQVICKNGVCDTTYVVIDPPISLDSVITTPACPTCPVIVCTVGDDIAVHTGATYTTCGTPAGYNQSGPDASGCYTYTPTSSISTTTVTTCQVICKNGVCDTTYVVINPPAPEKNNDVNITGTNTLVSGYVHTNDVVPPGTTYGPPTPNPSNPAGGVLNFSPDGSYTFIAPTPGVYKFIVPVCAPGQSLPCPTTELDITVLDPNTTSNPPVANTDLGTTKAGTPVTLNSLANDLSGNLGGNLNPTSVVVTTPPSNGTYSVNPTTGAITYTPNAGFTGKDTLYYSVKDVNGNSSIAMQVITVLPSDAGNTTTATDDYANAGKGQPASGNAKINDIDPEGNTTSITPLDSTIAGVGRFVIDAAGNYTFTPASGFTGPVSVPYTITDANGAKANATVHILISNKVAPLNVNWLGFNISNPHCLANLVWQVSSLENTSYFEVQKSSNSVNWKTIGKITDIDRTKLEAQFTFTDNELLKETNSYFRIKEIELNGNVYYSENRFANCKEGYSINIYPNPVEDKLTISFTRESDLEPTIMIYNMAGQQVQTNLITNTKNKEFVFSISHLASGVYTIIINDNDFGKSTYKVMKK